MTVEQRILAIVERATQAEPGSIRSTTPFSEMEGWDSMGVVEFLGALYDQFGVLVTVDEMATFRTVGDAVARVNAGRS